MVLQVYHLGLHFIFTIFVGIDAAETKPLIGRKREPRGINQYNILTPDTCVLQSTLAGQPSRRKEMAYNLWKVLCEQRKRTADLTDIIMYVNQEMGQGQCMEQRHTFSRHLKLKHEANCSLIDRLKKLVNLSRH